MKTGKKMTGSLLAILLLTVTFPAWAQITSATDIGGIAHNIQAMDKDILRLINTIAVVSGFAFGVAAAFKFKHHKDMPTQVTVAQPIMLFFVGVALIWLPYIIEAVGQTIVGENADVRQETSTKSFRKLLINQ